MLSLLQITACFFLAVLGCFHSFAQQGYFPLNREFTLATEAELNTHENTSHTAIKPFRLSYSDSLSSENLIHGNSNWFSRKLFDEHFISIDSGDYHIRIDPVFNLEYNKDFNDKSATADTTLFYTNTRGLRVAGDIGSKVSFESSFYENQSFFVNYISEYINGTQVVPGQGRVKQFKNSGFDYAMSSGLVSVSPINNLNFTFGHGKNFIGEGYRSLLLSDNSFNYPYLKIQTDFFKKQVQYTTTFTLLQTTNRMSFSHTPEALFIRKAGTFHYLSINLGKRIQLGLFEGVIWKASENNYAKSPNVLFYNPVMLFNTILFAGDTNNNVLNGINFKIKPINKAAVYGQLMIDNLKKRRYGYQLGFKYFDAFTVSNLTLQVEYNKVTPFTYSFGNTSQNYSHYNQALSHPIGAGFNESVGIVNYQFKGFFMRYKANFIQTIKNSLTGDFGYNIFLSDELIVPQVVSSNQDVNISYNDIQLGYIFNPKINLQFVAGCTFRDNSFENRTNQILYISLRTALTNNYYDF